MSSNSATVCGVVFLLTICLFGELIWRTLVHLELRNAGAVSASHNIFLNLRT